MSEVKTARRHRTELERLAEELIQTREQQNASLQCSSEVSRQPSPLELGPNRRRQTEDAIDLDNQQTRETPLDELELELGPGIGLGAIQSQLEEKIRAGRKRTEELQQERKALLLKVQALSKMDCISDQDNAAEMTDPSYDRESVNEQSWHSLAESSRNSEHASHGTAHPALQADPVGHDPRMIDVSDTAGISIDQCRPSDSSRPPDHARSRARHLDTALSQYVASKHALRLPIE